MKQPQWIKEGIALGNQFHYRKKNPLIHNTINIGLLVAVLSTIIGLLISGLYLSPFIHVPLAGFGIGICFFTLYILVIHEASHNMFVITKVRKDALFWNRLFGWGVSILFATNYKRHWEEGHHTHHIHPVEPDDPQTVNLYTGNEFLRQSALMLFVPGYVFLWNPSRKYDDGKWIPFANLGFWALAISVLLLTLPWTALLALLFGFNVVGTLNQLKGSLEHGGPIATEANRNLRSRTSLFPFRALIMPLNISLHFEHHLNYCVPWYELYNYHKALKPLVPQEVQSMIFNHRIVDQVMGRIGKFPEELRPYVDVQKAA